MSVPRITIIALIAAALAAVAIAAWPASEDALARAADGFAGSITAGDEFEQDLYQAELEVALDDLAGQASEFRAQGPEVQEAFWEGYEDGVSG